MKHNYIHLSFLLNVILFSSCGLFTSQSTTSSQSSNSGGIDSGSLTMQPATVTIVSGAQIAMQVTGKNSQGQIIQIENGPNVAWAIDKASVGTIDSSGIFSAKTSGSAVVTAVYRGKSVFATVNVAGGDSSGIACNAPQLFASNVQPLISSTCINCHSSNKSGTAKFSLPDDVGLIDSFRMAIISQNKINFTDPNQSQFLLRATNAPNNPHGGGKIIDTSDARYASVVAWVTEEGLCKMRADLAISKNIAGPVLTAAMAPKLSTCPTTGDFQTYVEPVLQRNCVSCHGAGQSASSSITISSGNSALGAAADWQGFVNRISASTANNILMHKLTGAMGTYTASSPILSVNSYDFATIKNWSDAEMNCQIQQKPTSLARFTGRSLLTRLKVLFPNALTYNAQNQPNGLIKPADYDLFASQGLMRQLSSPERFYQTGAIIAAQQLFSPLCTTFIDATDTKSNVFSTTYGTLSGEILPTDPSTKFALLAARNIWIFPYLADSIEVQDLVQTYNAVIADDLKLNRTGTVAMTDAKQMVCLTAMMAPQFWFGNASPADAVRRLSLEVGGKVPPLKDFQDFQAAKDPIAFTSSYLDTLQRSAATKQSYVDQMYYWFQDQWGLRPFVDGRTISEGLALGTGRGNGPTGSAGIAGRIVATSESGFADRRTIELPGPKATSSNPEYCTPGKLQAFNAATSRINYTHWNPTINAYDTIATSYRVNPSSPWISAPGAVTLADGTKLPTTVADFNAPSTEQFTGLYTYNSGLLKGTPVDNFPSDNNYRNKPPSVRKLGRVTNRYAFVYDTNTSSYSEVLQDGFDLISLPVSGESAYVCNAFSRLAFSCAQRIPPKTTNIGSTFNSADTNGITVPDVVDTFSCGVPNSAQIDLHGTPSYNEALAYPKTAPYNTVAFNYQERTFISDVDIHPEYYPGAAKSPYAEIRHTGYLIRAVQDETKKTLSHVLTDDLDRSDFRQVLLSTTTYGTPLLNRYYQNNVFTTLDSSNKYIVPGSDAEANAEIAISSSDISNIPLIKLTGSQGCLPFWYIGCKNSFYNNFELKNFNNGVAFVLPFSTYSPLVGSTANGFSPGATVRPLVISGVLGQHSFIDPVLNQNAGKARSVAARIISRLLCAEPNELTAQLSDSAQALHAQYVSDAEGGISHLDKKMGCYSCHVTLDPLAAAIDSNFVTPDRGTNNGRRSAGELGGLGEGFMGGFLGGGAPGQGAVMGTKVTGLQGIANALANTQQFGRCAVLSAYQRLLGHRISLMEDGLINDATTTFMSTGNWNFNSMLKDLVKLKGPDGTPIYVKGN